MQRDLHGAGLGAGAAERGGVRQVGRPREQRHEHRPHRPRVDRPVGAAARLAVDGAHVQAGAAADAVQHLGVARPAQRRAAVVEHDHVQLLRPVLLALAPRPGQQRRVRRQPLARAAAGEQLQHDREVGRRADEPLQAEDRDVHARERGDEPPVPLVGDQADRAGLGDGEVRAGDADVRLEEDLSELATRGLGQRSQLRRDLLALDGREEL